MSTRVYIAGPMSHIKNFNFPYFDQIAAKLRAQGYDVVSPAELDDPEFRDRVMAEHVTGYEKDLLGTWGGCLARDVKLISDGGIEGIILLADWQKSRGAKLEAFVGALCGRKFALYDSSALGFVLPVSSSWVMDQIRENMP
jgi:hypothetical protein